MKAGVFMYTQNSWDNQRFMEYEADPSNAANARRDADNTLWKEDLHFAEMVEDLGFDDLWTVEHHFSPYAQTTNTLQYLAYFAGKTKRIGLGTMVIVIPWHHPLRVAEELVTLQYMLGTERDLTIGFGRGAARREYGGWGIPQSESRERFEEGLEIIRLALGQERFSYEGKFFTIPDVEQRPQSPHLSLRPTPLDPDRLLQNMYGAWGSASSAPLLARLGLKPLIIPQRLMTEYESELGDFYAKGEEHGHAPTNPVAAQWVYCSTDKDAVERGHRAFAANGASGDVNYEFSSGFHRNVPGYEAYADRFAEMGKLMAQEGGTEILRQDAIVGDPQRCIDKIQELSDTINPRQWNFDFKFGDITLAEAEASIQLFAKEVLPFVKELEVKGPKVRLTA
jgi:alkanesulfonate monooxygenase SsuD/methylene tetrahydromethanopterin reductase-like flavin-dependent oxidoreductase (luciferase family)